MAHLQAAEAERAERQGARGARRARQRARPEHLRSSYGPCPQQSAPQAASTAQDRT